MKNLEITPDELRKAAAVASDKAHQTQLEAEALVALARRLYDAADQLRELEKLEKR